MELEHEFTVPVPVDQAWPVLLDVERIAPCMPGATLDSVDGDEFTGRLKVKLGAMTITYKGSARIAAQDRDAHTVSIEGTGKEARGSGTASATVQAQLHDEGEQTRVTVHTKLNVTGRPAQFGRNILAEVGGKLINRFAGNLAEEITREEPAEAVPEASAPPAEEPQVAPAPSGEGAPQAAETVAEPQAVPVEAAEPVAEPQAPVEATAAGSGTPEAPPKAAERPTTARASDDDAINLLEFAGPSIAKRLAPVVAGLAAVWALRRLVRRRGRRSGQ
jgi:carbon monoxide dehydrogenase subunit G